MPNAEDEIARLRAELEGMRAAIKAALALAQVAHETAACLAATHHNPAAALVAFNEIASAADGPMLYSRATDADLQGLEVLREAVRMQLRSLQQKP